MKTHIVAAVSVISILSLGSSAQAQNKTKDKQLSLLVGYTPAHVGSKINHDKRLAASFRLSDAKLIWDFDLEYYTSNDSWARPFHDGGDRCSQIIRRKLQVLASVSELQSRHSKTQRSVSG